MVNMLSQKKLKMKYFLGTFLLIFLSCSDEKKGNEFVINGKVINNSIDSLFLYANGQKIDSSKILNNQFTFKGIISGPLEVSISTAGLSASNRNFFVDNSKIDVEIFIEFKEINNYFLEWVEIKSVKGSETSIIENEFYDFKQSFKYSPNPNNELYNMLDKIIEKHSKHPISASLLHDISNDTILTTNQLVDLYNRIDLNSQNPINLQTLDYTIFRKNENFKNQMIVDFELSSFDRELINSKSFRQNNYVFFDFWATWCLPCIKEIPELKNIKENYKHKNFKILGISLDTNKDRWEKFIEKENLLWGNVIDTTGFKGDIASQYKIRAIPFNLLVNPNGNIIEVNLTMTELSKKLDSIFVTN
jgi:thiol-disulfide isomerase/thioredoxin